ncbi:MAG: SAM-dependent methyltransferase, partial [Pedobacter sp.]|nr:SAM-dependent methyltransferase [Pedobacter sp.]
MKDTNITNKPKNHTQIAQKSEEVGFTMPSDLYIGALLKTLITSKPNSNLLELGTGIGLSLSWMIDGMDGNSKLISVDNDKNLTAIANQFFGEDERITIICADGSRW